VAAEAIGLLDAGGPLVAGESIVFRVRTAGEPGLVRLCQELSRPRVGPELTRAGGVWSVRFPRAEVDRMEYQFQVIGPADEVVYALDPGNPLRVPGPFGDKSVVELPGYRPPDWLGGPPVLPDGLPTVPVRTLGTELEIPVWSPPGVPARRRLPLVVAHDGPDYARYGGLLTMLARLVAGGRVPPVRAALLAPVDRDEHYSASPAYTAALATEILPALIEAAPARPDAVVGLGASLGAVAMLHAHRGGAPLAGLLLQSGSFFTPVTDPQEAGYRRFGRITAFTAELLDSRGPVPPVPVTLTCGLPEENLANNHAVAATLAGQGYPAELVTGRDAHNWVAWRDLLHPHLTRLLAAAGG
jgi:enterochelin esterase family protein